MQGRPLSEAPLDATPILVEVMNYCGVPETGGYSFELLRRHVVAEKFVNYVPVKQDEGDNFKTYYGVEILLRWFPGDTDPATVTLTERTNWNFIPSNGSHGDAVYDSWCAKCIRERPIRENYDHAVANGLGCDIYLRTMAFKISDPQYPTEWTYKPDGVPKCTAFEKDVGEPKQEPRCPLTIEMFPDEPAPPTGPTS